VDHSLNFAKASNMRIAAFGVERSEVPVSALRVDRHEAGINAYSDE
jgi:hypothetical protein